MSREKEDLPMIEVKCTEWLIDELLASAIYEYYYCIDEDMRDEIFSEIKAFLEYNPHIDFSIESLINEIQNENFEEIMT